MLTATYTPGAAQVHPRLQFLHSLALLPYFTFLLFGATFALAFYFSTLLNEKVPACELAVASTTSLLGGFGVVAMFCTVGVDV
ncbi:hypothetical protein FKP32DRAFT_1681088 [Trametes sanguinea]|nr:hypothetical protein FKP32DRAFT_1681088 [Trametes sanguinea]